MTRFGPVILLSALAISFGVWMLRADEQPAGRQQQGAARQQALPSVQIVPREGQTRVARQRRVVERLAADEMPLNEPPPGFTALFNGQDFTGWKVPEGDGGHWKVVDGVIDYDAASEAAGDKNLWTEREFGDFVLMLDWRIKRTTGRFNMPIVLSDGTHLKDAAGQDILLPLPNADSGIYLRGSSRSQINIWCWPIGSGEVYGYRTRADDPEVRTGVTPRTNADRRVGQWNTFIVVMVGDRLTLLENGHTVLENSRLPDVPERGAFALQHHGGLRNGEYTPASSLVQFRNIYIKELPRPETAAAGSE